MNDKTDYNVEEMRALDNAYAEACEKWNNNPPEYMEQARESLLWEYYSHI